MILRDIPERLSEPEHPGYDTVYLNRSIATAKDGPLIHKDTEKKMKVILLLQENIDSDKRYFVPACGMGKDAYALAVETGGQVIGSDIDERAIRRANKVFSHPGLEFRVEDVYELPYEGEFDVVVSIDSFHHFNSPFKAAENFYRSLIPGGAIYIEDFDRTHVLDNDVAKSILELRRSISEEEFLKRFFAGEIFKDRKLGGGPYKLEEERMVVLSINSYLAAYTPTQINLILKETGFSHIHSKSGGDRYVAVAVK